jgi:hypothetical protein
MEVSSGLGATLANKDRENPPTVAQSKDVGEVREPCLFYCLLSVRLAGVRPEVADAGETFSGHF